MPHGIAVIRRTIITAIILMIIMWRSTISSSGRSVSWIISANNKGFKYADTDSIHCDLPENKLKGLKIDDKKFCCWKIEAHWDWGYFIRQKTYIEYENGKYNIKCAGMPEKCKEILVKSMEGDLSDLDKYTDEEQEFISTKRSVYDIKTGLCVPGKLLPKRIVGGVLLTDTTFEMR